MTVNVKNIGSANLKKKIFGNDNYFQKYRLDFLELIFFIIFQ